MHIHVVVVHHVSVEEHLQCLCDAVDAVSFVMRYSQHTKGLEYIVIYIYIF